MASGLFLFLLKLAERNFDRRLAFSSQLTHHIVTEELSV
jgi:hypothetical protein